MKITVHTVLSPLGAVQPLGRDLGDVSGLCGFQLNLFVLGTQGFNPDVALLYSRVHLHVPLGGRQSPNV